MNKQDYSIVDEHEYDDEMYDTIWITNRDRKTKPKLGIFYCGCDMDMVGVGEKCSVCGYKEKTKHMKRDTNA